MEQLPASQIKNKNQLPSEEGETADIDLLIGNLCRLEEKFLQCFTAGDPRGLAEVIGSSGDILRWGAGLPEISGAPQKKGNRESGHSPEIEPPAGFKRGQKVSERLLELKALHEANRHLLAAGFQLARDLRGIGRQGETTYDNSGGICLPTEEGPARLNKGC